MFILDSLLVNGIRFVLEKVAAAAEAASEDDSVLREQLLEAQMDLDLGKISESEYDEIEKDLFEKIREKKGAPQGAISITSKDKITGVEIETFKED